MKSPVYLVLISFIFLVTACGIGTKNVKSTPESTPMTYIDKVNKELLTLNELEENITELPRLAWENSQKILTENSNSLVHHFGNAKTGC
jgi:hypothetical protein|tara:strand:+ start:1097 stop:1363 length:267 start_codon:yes stop_codon:yes gene_type:complete